ncbi:hypothetical protein KEM56_003151, partial [Ascosphaera pollenicola]
MNKAVNDQSTSALIDNPLDSYASDPESSTRRKRQRRNRISVAVGELAAEKALEKKIRMAAKEHYIRNFNLINIRDCIKEVAPEVAEDPILMDFYKTDTAKYLTNYKSGTHTRMKRYVQWFLKNVFINIAVKTKLYLDLIDKGSTEATDFRQKMMLSWDRTIARYEDIREEDFVRPEPLHHCDFSKGIHRSCASCASAKIACNSVPAAGREKMIALAEEAACINVLSDEEKKNQLLRVRTLAMSFCDDFAEVMTPRTSRKSTGERGGKKSIRKGNGAATAAAALSEAGEQNKGRQNRHTSRLRQINLTLEDEDS